MVEFATGHALCGPKPPDGCTFFSFGINDDPSFDVKLADLWGCRGFAGDPTVLHPSKLHPLVTFHNVGASMLVANEERNVDKGGSEEWWDTSMTSLRYWLKLEHVNIIKMDCEGCEFALARDILREDPTFVYNVDQLSIETHVSKSWMTTREHFFITLHCILFCWKKPASNWNGQISLAVPKDTKLLDVSRSLELMALPVAINLGRVTQRLFWERAAKTSFGNDTDTTVKNNNEVCLHGNM